MGQLSKMNVLMGEKPAVDRTSGSGNGSSLGLMWATRDGGGFEYHRGSSQQLCVEEMVEWKKIYVDIVTMHAKLTGMDDTGKTILSLIPDKYQDSWPLVADMVTETQEELMETQLYKKGYTKCCEAIIQSTTLVVRETRRVKMLLAMVEEYCNMCGPTMVLLNLCGGTNTLSSTSRSSWELLQAISTLCEQDRAVTHVVTIGGKQRVFKRPRPPLVLSIVARSLLEHCDPAFQALIDNAINAESFLSLRALSTMDRDVHLATVLGVHGSGIPAALLEVSSQITAGNPEHIEILCRHLISLRVIEKTSEGVVMRQKQALNKVPVPTQIRNDMISIFESCDLAHQRVLMVAAILGHVFTLDDLLLLVKKNFKTVGKSAEGASSQQQQEDYVARQKIAKALVENVKRGETAPPGGAGDDQTVVGREAKEEQIRKNSKGVDIMAYMKHIDAEEVKLVAQELLNSDIIRKASKQEMHEAQIDEERDGAGLSFCSCVMEDFCASLTSKQAKKVILAPMFGVWSARAAAAKWLKAAKESKAANPIRHTTKR